MIESTFLDARTLGQLAKGPDSELSSALVTALAEEVCTMRWAVESLVRSMEVRSPGTRDIVLQDLREALREGVNSPRGQRADMADHLFNALELDRGPGLT